MDEKKSSSDDGPSAKMVSSTAFALSVKFDYDNSTKIEDFLRNSASDLEAKDIEKPLEVLRANWVKTVADLRLLIQEGQLRGLGLPLRLCIWIEAQATRCDDTSGLIESGFAEVKGIGGTQSFEYAHDFDQNGILYFLGTRGGTQSWQNPASLGVVTVTTSGLLHDSVPMAAVVGREVVRCVTSSSRNAWYAIDLGNHWVRPNRYTIRHYSSWDTEALRDWVFEGSNDGSSWTLLREHVSDTTLRQAGQSATFDVKPPKTGFHMFRIKMTGPNSNQHWYLALSGMELYGQLSTTPPSGGGSVKQAKVFVHETPFDTNGIIYHLGSQGGTAPFKNPVDVGAVNVLTSGLMKDSEPAKAVVGRSVVRCCTKQAVGSFFTIDFKANRVAPTDYSLRHYSSWDVEAVRSWDFQASNDGENWTTLRSHTDDAALDKKGAAHTWSLPANFHDQPFRYFRIWMTGPNSNNHLYLALSGFEIYGKLVSSGAGSNPVPGIAPKNTFIYRHDQDTNGLVHWIGTKGLSQPFSNPATSGDIIVTASSLMHDSTSADAICGKELVRCVTKPQPNSWFQIDFKDKWVCPTAYMLRHYLSWDVEALRGWNFEGSNDGRTWTIIKKHENDTSLNRKGATHTWPIADCPSAFRMFRVLQTALNSNKHSYLSLSGFEIYGHVYDKPPPGVADGGGADDVKSQLYWDETKRSRFLAVDANTNTVTNRGSSDKWQLARTRQQFAQGKVALSVRILQETPTTNTWKFIVGAVPVGFPVGSKEWVGAINSWGYIATGGKCHKVAASQKYGEPYGGGDTITVELDFDLRTIVFYKNGVSQGVAFTDLLGPVHLAVSLTGTGSKVMIVAPDLVPASAPAPAALPAAAAGGGGASGAFGWDSAQKGKFMAIQGPQNDIACNKGSSNKWMAVRGAQEYSKGVCQFSVEIIEDNPTNNNWRFIVGVVPSGFPLTWVGVAGSWGYVAGTGGKVHQKPKSIAYGDKFALGDRVTVVMDFTNGTLSFSLNGVSQGVAFTNLKGPVYAAVSITGTESKARIYPQ